MAMLLKQGTTTGDGRYILPTFKPNTDGGSMATAPPTALAPTWSQPFRVPGGEKDAKSSTTFPQLPSGPSLVELDDMADDSLELATDDDAGEEEASVTEVVADALTDEGEEVTVLPIATVEPASTDPAPPPLSSWNCAKSRLHAPSVTATTARVEVLATKRGRYGEKGTV